MQIKKAVFPVAGLGSRFLPATKAQPKEMLTVVDKPLIQYAVEEAVEAGITEMIFVTGRNKRAIEDHFDTAYELEAELEAAGKQALLDLVQNVIPKNVHCIYIRQAAALGLGHAVLCARPVIGNHPFAVLLADDLMDAEPGYPSAIAQMAQQYYAHRSSVVAVQEVEHHLVQQYGIVSIADQFSPEIFGNSHTNLNSRISGGESRGENRGENSEQSSRIVSHFADPHLHRISGIVEKPQPHCAPSNLGVVGRYIFSPEIFDYLEHIGKGAGGEIQLTDAIAAMLKDFPVLAYTTAATRYDCGSKLGYLKASVAFGLKHPEVAKEFQDYLQQTNRLVKQQQFEVPQGVSTIFPLQQKLALTA
ncbi:UTP--glucose-1-phosphate uridylyltransferase [Undibacterium sp. Ji22W]|uniref:UTP--glucose-1-phosphate uridylyltransferase n=1 Tax=Undibacterium sp. Ji22W TaxID=3413038 RepID=UPI003BF1A19A